VGGLGEDLGGYKGYGNSMVVELLSSALSQANFLKALTGVDKDGKPTSIELGHSFLAIRIDAFCDLDAFKHQVGEICRQIRASRKAPGATRIWTPGEKEYEISLYRKDKGVPFNASLKASFKAVKERCNLKIDLPF